jgi:hypothetical protein
VRSLLQEAGIIHDPDRYRSVLLHGGEDVLTHASQNRFITPGRIRHQMMQRLVHTLHLVGRQTRSHRFHALALARQQQSGAVGFQRGIAISVPCGLRQAIRVCRKAFLLWAWRGLRTHKTILQQFVFF